MKKLNILLINITNGKKGKFIPLALRRLSAKHKLNNDNVELIDSGSMPKRYPDVIYFSLIFLFNAKTDLNWILTYKKKFPKSKIIVGGTAITVRPDLYSKYLSQDMMFIGRDLELEKITPDFSFDCHDNSINKTYCYGFTTRGCPNKCGWCFVPKLEGRHNVLPNWENQIDTTKNIFYCFDNNLLACGDKHLRSLFQFLTENNMRIDCNQGMDAEIFYKNKKIQQVFIDYPDIWHCIRFSWDNNRVDKYIKYIFDFLKENNITSTQYNLMYILYDSEFASPQKVLERIKFTLQYPNKIWGGVKSDSKIWTVKLMRYKDMEHGSYPNSWGYIGDLFAATTTFSTIGLIYNGTLWDYLLDLDYEDCLKAFGEILIYIKTHKKYNTSELLSQLKQSKASNFNNTMV